MYIAETLINPLFTDVTFRRDSDGDRSGHYESDPRPQCHLRACDETIAHNMVLQSNLSIWIVITSLA